MIWTVIQTSWRRLKNNRSELFLTFVVPMIFFSIFALIFGSRDSSSATPKIKIAISDEDNSELSKGAVKVLEEQRSLRITQQVDKSSAAEDLVRRGMVTAAISFSKTGDPKAGAETPRIEVLSDSYDQVSSQVLAAIVQKAVMTANAEVAKNQSKARADAMNATASANYLDSPNKASNSSNGVRQAGFTSSPIVGALGASSPVPGMLANSSMAQPPQVEIVDVIGGKKTNPVIAMYAAGIAVMFLLFSATTASGSLLEERENSTLDRLLCSRLTMDQLLLGKWSYLTLIGTIQMTLMFLWGAIVFKIDLWRHLDGFAAMTLVTAGAASSFALMLAALCKSRMQLGWVSTIVILSMSALGGSMVPRYLMSENIQRVGLFTFNAWALEGYNKIFWRELPLKDVGMELSVLTACGFLFIVAARIFAIRWERS